MLGPHRPRRACRRSCRAALDARGPSRARSCRFSFSGGFCAPTPGTRRLCFPFVSVAKDGFGGRVRVRAASEPRPASRPPRHWASCTQQLLSPTRGRRAPRLRSVTRDAMPLRVLPPSSGSSLALPSQEACAEHPRSPQGSELCHVSLLGGTVTAVTEPSP